jgi:hypothetical protein
MSMALLQSRRPIDSTGRSQDHPKDQEALVDRVADLDVRLDPLGANDAT